MWEYLCLLAIVTSYPSTDVWFGLVVFCCQRKMAARRSHLESCSFGGAIQVPSRQCINLLELLFHQQGKVKPTSKKFTKSRFCLNSSCFQNLFWSRNSNLVPPLKRLAEPSHSMVTDGHANAADNVTIYVHQISIVMPLQRRPGLCRCVASHRLVPLLPSSLPP